MQNSRQKPHTMLILEGNIGAGKSTFLRILEKSLPEVGAVFEPTARWQAIGGEANLLDLFYKNTKRWAYTFQSYAFISRIHAQVEHKQKHPETPIQVLERSVFCDRYCFAKNCYEMGTMSELEWGLYTEWFEWLARDYAPRPQGFIYLQTSPKVCLKRLCKRSRQEESDISLEYLISLHSKHESWLVKKKDVASYLQDIPVLVLDCDIDFETNEKHCRQLIDQVATFISLLHTKPRRTLKHFKPTVQETH